MSRRPIIPDIQFYKHDSEDVRLEKLRRLTQMVADFMRTSQANQTTVTPTVGFTITGPSIVGRILTSSGDAVALTPGQVTAILTTFTAANKGLVPAPGSIVGGRFLSETGAWAVPPTSTGPEGPRGPQGLPGVKGDDGETGEQGPPGVPGKISYPLQLGYGDA